MQDQRSLAAARTSLSEKVTVVLDAEAKAGRLSDELTETRNRMAKALRQRDASSMPTSLAPGQMGILQTELNDYRRKVKCSVCNDREKNCVIAKVCASRDHVTSCSVLDRL